ncbi:MAG: BMP family ABC transporter substrate-binding protein [Oscillospiraceae bacterium]
MAYTDYQKALKIGEKTYKSCTSEGSYPYLPVLEDMLSKEKSESQVKLGLVEIPIELIVGTYTSGRTTAFAWDFMPLLDPDTEFASKWSHLYDSLTEEGQRDPIIAYEYMNRFYIVEGNKRVSVQKYMGAVSIEGNVTRIIPQKDDSKENRIYFEFLDFYAKTRINYILMSNEGAYEKLYKHIHPQDNEPLTEDEALEFKFIYSSFKKEYLEKGGHKLNSTIGDVLLTYIDIFGYDDIKKKSSLEIKKDITKIWSEFIMLSEEKPFSMIMNPTDESQKKSITKLLQGTSQPLKVAFVHYKEPSISGWSYCHEMGREHIQSVFGEKIQTESFATYDSSDIQLLENIIDEGYKVIFTTTPVLNGISLKCAVQHPDVIILNCSLNTAFRHVRTYYLRIYEAKFIIGAIAGILTEENRIGYIADYPIFGMPASINAFALGVKLVNPRARVYLDWSTLKNGHNPFERFDRYDVDIVSNRDITAPVQESREFGLYGLYGDTRFNIAMPVWNWGIMYESLIRSVINGAWKNDENANGIHALNYYWGMSSDAIDVIFSQKIPSSTRQLIRILKNQIKSGEFNPFSDEIYSQNGRLMNEQNHVMTPEEIINMDWFVDNVCGKIPDISELDEGCHELISQLGVKRD